MRAVMEKKCWKEWCKKIQCVEKHISAGCPLRRATMKPYLEPSDCPKRRGSKIYYSERGDMKGQANAGSELVGDNRKADPARHALHDIWLHTAAN